MLHQVTSTCLEISIQMVTHSNGEIQVRIKFSKPKGDLIAAINHRGLNQQPSKHSSFNGYYLLLHNRPPRRHVTRNSKLHIFPSIQSLAIIPLNTTNLIANCCTARRHGACSNDDRGLQGLSTEMLSDQILHTRLGTCGLGGTQIDLQCLLEKSNLSIYLQSACIPYTLAVAGGP